MNKTKKVAIFVETSTAYGREILAGIADYLNTHHHWSVFLERADLTARPYDWISSNQWDGILCRQTDASISNLLLATRVPVVDLTNVFEIPFLPWVGSDHSAIGVLGAKYFKDLGVRDFAYCGFTNELWSQLRKEGFRKSVAEFGGDYHVWQSPWTGRAKDYWAKDIERIAQWITALPKPVGIMAANDLRALHVIEACNQLNVMIPHEVAVLGVDDEKTLSNLYSPRLSSILPDCKQIGFRAAELLDNLMSGSRQKGERILIQPKGVIPRPSTDILAVNDQLVVKAIKKMTKMAADDCSLHVLSKELDSSPRVLENRFKKVLNRTVTDVIRWICITRIQKLLLDTDYSLEKVAQQVGYRNTREIDNLFKNHLGISAETYRLRHRKGEGRLAESKNSGTISGIPEDSLHSLDSRKTSCSEDESKTPVQDETTLSLDGGI